METDGRRCSGRQEALERTNPKGLSSRLALEVWYGSAQDAGTGAISNSVGHGLPNEFHYFFVRMKAEFGSVIPVVYTEFNEF